MAQNGAKPRDGFSDLLEAILRIGRMLAVYLPIAVIGYGLLVWQVAGAVAGSDTARTKRNIDALVSFARDDLTSWFVMGTAFSFFIAAFFVLAAQFNRKRTLTRADEARTKPFWFGGILLLFAALVGAWYLLVIETQVPDNLAGGTYGWGLFTGFVLPILAYWLGTALNVHIMQKKSVPLSVLTPAIWN